MLYVNESHFAAVFLCLGNAVQSQRGFTGRLRAINLYHTAAGQAADAQRQVQRQTAGGNGVHVHGHVLAQLHHRAFTELFFNLRKRRLQRRFFIARRLFGGGHDRFFLCHCFLQIDYCNFSISSHPSHKPDFRKNPAENENSIPQTAEKCNFSGAPGTHAAVPSLQILHQFHVRIACLPADFGHRLPLPPSNFEHKFSAGRKL